MGFYTDSEIVGMYRNALDPEMQIEILSQLNCCTQEEIRRILDKYGIEVQPNRVYHKAGIHGSKHKLPKRSHEQLDAEFRPCYMEGMTDTKIAKVCSSTLPTVRRWRERYNLPPNET